MKKTITANFLRAAIFIAMVSVFNSCKKDNPVVLNYTLSQDALAYIKLNKGEYFIYRDSVSDETDSVVVTESLVESYDGEIESKAPYTSQQFSLILTQYPNNKVWLSGYSPGYLMGRVQLISSDDLDILIFQDVSTIIPFIVVEGKTYTNVSLTTSADETTATAYYWVKGVGLIKRVETNGTTTQTYTLLRHD